jgi:hypothetical protein
MPIKPLDRLLFVQGGRCFFCNVNLPRAEASVEHLVAQVNGGTNADENCVACCREINALLGRMSVKEKIRIILNQKGKFVCPATGLSGSKPAVAAVATLAPKPNPPAPDAKPVDPAMPDYYPLVLADLNRRPLAMPKRVESLKNTIRSVVKNANGSVTEPQLDALVDRLHADGKIQITDTKVAYSL